MNGKITVFVLVAIFFTFPTMAQGASTCSVKMYKYLASLDVNNTDDSYWDKARVRAHAICKECENVKQCIGFVNSVNKNTSKFQVLGLLSRIDDLQNYDIDTIKHDLNYFGPDLEPDDSEDAVTFVEI